MFKSRRVSETVDFLELSANWRSYLAIMRVDHWFKNVFMLVGVILAAFHVPTALIWSNLPILILGLIATCILSSSNYVLNEVHDAEFDCYHPKKKFRPVPSGRINISLAYVTWAALAIVGVTMAAFVNRPFVLTSVLFLFMGLMYNVKPIRLKDLPYLDVLTEALNTPIRILLGWFVVVPSQIPPLSLLCSFWLLGAFFMATKRFAEYRMINDSKIAGIYRKSFQHYTETRLLTSTVYYLSLFALFFGVFIVKYHFELVLAAPLIIGFTSYYFHISLNEDSVVQAPEYLYQEKWLILSGLVCVAAVFLLLFTEIPLLYEWTNLLSNQVRPLWTF